MGLGATNKTNRAYRKKKIFTLGLRIDFQKRKRVRGIAGFGGTEKELKKGDKK